jgi:SAM-dependent methyltransferase
VRFAPLIPQGTVLDLACGSGRHSRLLGSRGLQVLAVDRDTSALQSLSSDRIRTLCIDLEAGDSLGSHASQLSIAARELLQPDQFEGIVVTNYLHRPLLPLLFASLIDGGVLIYETFAQGNGAFGKPSNPDFLLAAGELFDAARGAPCRMHVVAFEDGFQSAPRPAMVQRLCALRADSAPIAQQLVL